MERGLASNPPAGEALLTRLSLVIELFFSERGSLSDIRVAVANGIDKWLPTYSYIIGNVCVLPDGCVSNNANINGNRSGRATFGNISSSDGTPPVWYILLMRTCTTCKLEKPLVEFHRRSNRLSGKQTQCSICVNARRREYRKTNKEKIRAWNKKRNPGWNIDRYNQHLELQNNKCAICKTDNPGLSDWCCDHNHVTNEPRGLLCVQCNAGLGYFKDNPEYLQSAIDYLNQWS